jgi:hypothetical protein
MIQAFDDLMGQFGCDRLWQQMNERQRESVVLRLLDQIELFDKGSRLLGIRAFLYIAQVSTISLSCLFLSLRIIPRASFRIRFRVFSSICACLSKSTL